MQTRPFPPAPDGRSPAGAEIRYLIEGETGGMIHSTVPPGQVNRAAVHATVSEFWHVLAGEGRIWRRGGTGEETTVLTAGVTIDIPVGTAFQYRCDGAEPLRFLCVTMPPWPGDEEAAVIEGPWTPTAPVGWASTLSRSSGRWDDPSGRFHMPRQIITTDSAPSSPLFSQGVVAGSQVFISGTTGIDPSTGRLAGDGIEAQTRQALANCEAILHAAGATLDDVVEVGVLLIDPADFAGMNEEYARWFPSDPPARYAAKLGAEIPGLLVSIRMTASLA